MVKLWYEDFPQIIYDNEPTKWFKLFIKFTNEFPVKIKKILIYQLFNIEIVLKYNNNTYQLYKNDVEIEENCDLVQEKIWEFEIQMIPKLPVNKLDINCEITF